MAKVAVIHIVTALRSFIDRMLIISKVQSALMCKCVGGGFFEITLWMHVYHENPFIVYKPVKLQS